jgi:hypothetical protein
MAVVAMESASETATANARKSTAEATNVAAAHVSAAAEPAAHMSATTETATVSAPTSPAARKRVTVFPPLRAAAVAKTIIVLRKLVLNSGPTTFARPCV